MKSIIKSLLFSFLIFIFFNSSAQVKSNIDATIYDNYSKSIDLFEISSYSSRILNNEKLLVLLPSNESLWRLSTIQNEKLFIQKDTSEINKFISHYIFSNEVNINLLKINANQNSTNEVFNLLGEKFYVTLNINNLLFTSENQLESNIIYIKQIGGSNFCFISGML